MTAPTWQTSNALNDVLDDLLQCEQTDAAGPWSMYIEWLDDLGEIIEQFDSKSLLYTVDETVAKLEQLVENLTTHDFALSQLAQTTLRKLQQNAHYQRLRLEQRQTEQNNTQHQEARQRTNRAQHYRLLEQQFSRECPKCGANMTIREHRQEQTPFWGCVRFGTPAKCRGTRQLTQIEQAQLTQ